MILKNKINILFILKDNNKLKKMQNLQLFEEKCINATKAINDARASDDYGCLSIKYLLHLIHISVNKYKNLNLTLKLCTAISEYMPEYKMRRYTINLDTNENFDIEDMDIDNTEICSEKYNTKEDIDKEEVCHEKYNTKEDIDKEEVSLIEDIIQKSHRIKKMNPFIKECEEAILFNYDVDKTYNNILKRINYFTNLIENCIDNYEDPDLIVRLCITLTEYVSSYVTIFKK